MEPFWIMFWSVAAAVLVLFVLPAFLLSYIIFHNLLVRNKPEKWGHSYSAPDDPEIVTMFDAGLAWREAHKEVRHELRIQNDGLSLYGEYFDFGYDRAVIILAGRMECCIYSLYFAEPYRLAGCNVLVIDGRAHGLSEGRYNYVGYRECRDILAWGKLLHDELRVSSILLHGICIGASTCLFAMTEADCPAYFDGITVEGMYKSFYLSTKHHMLHNRRPLFPFLYVIMLYMRVILGVNAVSDGPYKRIGRLTKPILFLHGRADAFSLPAFAEELYADCKAPKRMVWFDRGKHSRMRINNTEAYDAALSEFVKEVASVPPTEIVAYEHANP